MMTRMLNQIPKKGALFNLVKCIWEGPISRLFLGYGIWNDSIRLDISKYSFRIIHLKPYISETRLGKFIWKNTFRTFNWKTTFRKIQFVPLYQEKIFLLTKYQKLSKNSYNFTKISTELKEKIFFTLIQSQLLTKKLPSAFLTYLF